MDDKVLKEGYDLTYENARELIEDAQLLKKSQRYSRAYTLFQLAIEEIGKCRLIWCGMIDFYQGKQISEEYFKDNNFLWHNAKTKSSLKAQLEAILLFEMQTGNSLQKMKDAIRNDYENIPELNSLKNKSLYVDIENEEFISPKDQITEEMVDKIELKARIRLEAQNLALTDLSELKILAERIQDLDSDTDKLNDWLDDLISD
ncbi:AbiV family abortive infection protein [Fodinibius sp.]|uniref:AbiV family abortive infection protein n=1 Tax=Fodinibius sp. TaxID=1872440 RepID=UPI002ACDCAA8|nr:AbiV family abortive infection protein [Fodinibius sp.]MDZ7658149.1 AbiV family abortive infection protein [Fodinibius sp.]